MDNPLRGIALIIGATMLFSISDMISKIAAERLPAVEISVFRYIIFVTMAAFYCVRSHARPLHIHSKLQQVARGIGLIGSALCYIKALSMMPLADAAAISFISPMLITALSVPLLGEIVGIRRWMALVVGLIGVLIVIRPGTGAFHLAALWVLASSTSWAFASVLTRHMAGNTDSASTLLWSAATGLLVGVVALPFIYVAPTLREIALCAALGIFASSGQFLMVLAYRHAGATILAPFSYVQLAWAAGLGFAFWGTLPDGWTWLGTAVIMASGIYTVHRERVRARS